MFPDYPELTTRELRGVYRMAIKTANNSESPCERATMRNHVARVSRVMRERGIELH